MTNRNNLITPEGRQALEKELDYLWRIERRKTTQAVTEAALTVIVRKTPN